MSDRTLPPEARVRRRADYLRVQKQSARVAAPHFVFLLTPTPPSATSTEAARRPRLGIIASKAVGNAVVRARAKRLVRAAFREVWTRFPVGLDVVVLVRGDINGLSLADVLLEWRGAENNIIRRGRAALVAPESPASPPASPQKGRLSGAGQRPSVVRRSASPGPDLPR